MLSQAGRNVCPQARSSRAIAHLHRPGLHFHQQQRAARRHDHHVDFTIMVMAAMHGVQGDAMKNFIPIR